MAQSSVSVKVGPLVSAKPFDAAALLNVLILLFFVFVVFVAVYLQKAPAAVTQSAPPDVFSSGRAMNDLKVIAAGPRPVGTTQHVAVRQYIVQRLSSLGLEPQVQTTTAVNSNYSRAGTVNNILAKLRGASGGKALVLSTHYDSVPYGPGANDAGTAVAALLETARALKTGGQLKNDLIFLFTDGEEIGLLGAQAFTSEHPWAKDVGLVLNFEARGNTGPSIMFESSNNNAWLIDGLDQAAPAPVSNSLAYEVYRLLPNDTDLTVFKKAGWAGLNFAYIDGLTHYHTRLDDLGNTDERSLQHHGSYALALARHFGNTDLTRGAQGNAVYFNILGTTLLHYSYAWNIPLAIFTLLITIAVLIIGVREGELTLRGIAWGTLTFVVALALSWLVVTGVWWLINLVANRTGSIFQNSAFRSEYYFLSFLALAAALFAGMVQWSRKKSADANLFAGVLVLFALLLLPATLFLPGASYLFVWPLLAAAVALLIAFITTDRSQSTQRLGILALGALPGLLLLGPTVYFLYTALVLSMPAALIVLAVLALGLLTPALGLPAVSKRWLLPAGLTIASVALLAIAGLNSGFNHQRSDLFYAMNAGTGKAIWASSDAQLNDWTRQFLAQGKRGEVSQFFPSRNRSFLQSEAPAIQDPAPALAVLKDENGSDVRRVQLKITSPRQAPSLVVFVDADVLKAAINGKEITTPAALRGGPVSGWSMQYGGTPVEGFDLALEVKPSQPLKITIVDRTDGLPQSINGNFKSRPADLVPSSNPFSDATFISRQFTL